MATGALAAFGIQLKIGATAIAELLDASGPNMSMEPLDATNHGSTSGWKEFIGGLLDAGAVDFTIQYIPTAATHKNAAGGLLYLFINKTKQAFSIVWPGTTTWSFDAFVSAFNVLGPVAGKLTASVSLRLTGAPTLA